MEHREDRHKKELILYPCHEGLSDGPRLKIECAQDLTKVLADKLHEYGASVPGRQIFPQDQDIPLRVYDEDNKRLSEPLANVRITFQKLARTGTGKITNIEYIITKILDSKQ